MKYLKHTTTMTLEKKEYLKMRGSENVWSFGKLPDFNPKVTPKHPVRLPHLKAQRAYLVDLCKKYGGIMNFCYEVRLQHKTVSNWLKGDAMMSTDGAKMIEDVLGEKKIRFPNYLKREW